MFNFFSKPKADGKLWFTTDIHCHILPGLDDGSPSAERSIELIERMQRMGLTRLFASPHVTHSSFPNTPETIAKAKAELQQAMDAAGLTAKLENHAEYRLDELFDSQRAQGLLQPLPGYRLLVENSYIQEPLGYDELLFGLQMDGFRPILAHPERYYYYYNRPERYQAIHDAGVQFQVNILSLAGHYGKDEKRVAEKLIDMGLVDYLGTDLHGASHADSIETYLQSRDYKRHRQALEGKIKNDRI